MTLKFQLGSGANSLKGIRWFIYASIIEKKWRIAQVTLPPTLIGNTVLSLEKSKILPQPTMTVFSADPCGYFNDLLYAELANSFNGNGRIGVWDGHNWAYLNLPRRLHFAFPQIVEDRGNVYLFPETSFHAGPSLFPLDQYSVKVGIQKKLIGLEGERLIDGALFFLKNSWYLFATAQPEASGELNLWTSPSLEVAFTRHPSSPIAIGSKFGRMGGPVYMKDGEIYRFAQNSTKHYGGSVEVMKILKISEVDYSEIHVGSISINGKIGPHTILVNENSLFFDYYSEKVALFAGVRRLSQFALNTLFQKND